uniref:Uncharacterized protein n=1 Tax=Arundo donax TaxID=35708 RepID=A0A0A8YMU1_ARUDO
MDLHASRSRVARSVASRVTPNSPRPSSRPRWYLSVTRKRGWCGTTPSSTRAADPPRDAGGGGAQSYGLGLGLALGFGFGLGLGSWLFPWLLGGVAGLLPRAGAWALGSGWSGEVEVVPQKHTLPMARASWKLPDASGPSLSLVCVSFELLWR